MKTTFIVLLLQLFALPILLAQGSIDQAAILSRVINHPEAQTHLQGPDKSDIGKVYIVQYPNRLSDVVAGILSADNVVVVEEDELPANAKKWLRLRSIGISDTVASGVFNLFDSTGGNGARASRIQFELRKTGNEWEITNITVGGF